MQRAPKSETCGPQKCSAFVCVEMLTCSLQRSKAPLPGSSSVMLESKRSDPDFMHAQRTCGAHTHSASQLPPSHSSGDLLASARSGLPAPPVSSCYLPKVPAAQHCSCRMFVLKRDHSTGFILFYRCSEKDRKCCTKGPRNPRWVVLSR